MKDIKKIGNPTCSFCGEVALYDCPTNQGTWAYLCKECFKHYTNPSRASIGYRFAECFGEED